MHISNKSIDRRLDLLKIEDHLATMRGDFFGSKSSSTGSSPGYCKKRKFPIKHYKTKNTNKQAIYQSQKSKDKDRLLAIRNLFCNALSYFALHRCFDLILGRYFIRGKPIKYLLVRF